MLLFQRRLFALGDQHQLVQIRLFQRGPAEVVEQQAFRDRDQKGPGLAGFKQLLAAQQANERVLAQVFGAMGAGHVASEPTQQPAAVVAIERSDELLLGTLK